jgi:hypothetical protein
MHEVLHANIFFFIASIATVVFCILVSIALYHVITILRTIRRIIARIEAGSDVIAEDFATMRSLVVHGSLVSRILHMVVPNRDRRSKRSRSHTTSTSDDITD